jgi:uncharacterized protein YcfL
MRFKPTIKKPEYQLDVSVAEQKYIMMTYTFFVYDAQGIDKGG